MQSIRPYNKKTYVAFIDISGFKQMMRGKDAARSALNKFYNTLHQVANLFALRNQDMGGVIINVMAVSDCAIIFSRNQYPIDKINGLVSILNFLRFFNRRMINDEISPRILTTCSINYGDFFIERRYVNRDILKQFFFGKGYVGAYSDHEFTKPKIEVGECRIVKDVVRDIIITDEYNPFILLKENNKHLYFYWMLDNIDIFDDFINEYYIESPKNRAYYEHKKDILYKYCYGN